MSQSKAVVTDGDGPRSYLAEVADHTDQMVVLSTPDNRIEWVNQAFIRQTGVPFDEAVGRAPGDVLPVAPGTDVQHRIDAALEAGQSYSGEIPYEIDGQVRWFQVELQPIVDDGRVVRFVGFNRDISGTVQRAAEREHGHQLKAISSLAAGVAHEINTPVQYISDNVSFLQDSFSELVELYQTIVHTMAAYADQDPVLHERLAQSDLEFLIDEIPRALSQSSEGLKRVATIVQGMKEFAESGQGHFETDLNRAVSTTLDVTRGEWGYLADLDLDLDEGLGTVVCNEGEIKQVLLAVINNATHAIEEAQVERGRLTVSTHQTPHTAFITIGDNGCGMDSATRSRVFEAFFTTKEVGQGTGQGLTIAQAIVCQRNGGSIDVASEPGRGTTVTIGLPRSGDGNPGR